MIFPKVRNKMNNCVFNMSSRGWKKMWTLAGQRDSRFPFFFLENHMKHGWNQPWVHCSLNCFWSTMWMNYDHSPSTGWQPWPATTTLHFCLWHLLLSLLSTCFCWRSWCLPLRMCIVQRSVANVKQCVGYDLLLHLALVIHRHCIFDCSILLLR